MLVMAVAADQQPLVDPMMKRPRKFRLHVQMTAVTELGLRCFQEPPLDFWRMNGMTVDAAHVILQVLGPQEIAVLFAEFMAIEAAPARIG